MIPERPPVVVIVVCELQQGVVQFMPRKHVGLQRVLCFEFPCAVIRLVTLLARTLLALAACDTARGHSEATGADFAVVVASVVDDGRVVRLRLGLGLRSTLSIVNLGLPGGSFDFAEWAQLAPRVALLGNHLIQPDRVRVLRAADLVAAARRRLLRWPLCMAHSRTCRTTPGLLRVPARLTRRRRLLEFRKSDRRIAVTLRFFSNVADGRAGASRLLSARANPQLGIVL